MLKAHSWENGKPGDGVTAIVGLALPAFGDDWRLIRVITSDDSGTHIAVDFGGIIQY